MTIVRWNPNNAARTMADRTGTLFGDFLGGQNLNSNYFPWDYFGRNPASWEPNVEAYETADELVFRADVPGLKRDDIDLRLENGVLTISGHRRSDGDVTPENYHYFETRYGKFSRSFTLPHVVEQEEIHAAYTDGVLTIRLPKVESAKPRRIEVAV